MVVMWYKNCLEKVFENKLVNVYVSSTVISLSTTRLAACCGVAQLLHTLKVPMITCNACDGIAACHAFCWVYLCMYVWVLPIFSSDVTDLTTDLSQLFRPCRFRPFCGSPVLPSPSMALLQAHNVMHTICTEGTE